MAYLPKIAHTRAVSVTMAVRLPSWDMQFGLPPVFEMNLPEGVLCERLRLTFAKATGTFDEFDLLSIVGRSKLGRIRITGQKEQLQEDVPFQSVDISSTSSPPSPISAACSRRFWFATKVHPSRSAR
jgi:serine/threonine-protein kinase HipA